MLPPFGLMHCQNRMWFQCWPALLNTGAMSGLLCDSLTMSSSDLPCSVGVLLDEAVQRRDIGLVVLAVMQLQGFLAHPFCREGGLGIGEGRKFESHGASSAGCSEAMQFDGSGLLAMTRAGTRQAGTGFAAAPPPAHERGDRRAGAPARPRPVPHRAVRAAGEARCAADAVRVQPRTGAGARGGVGAAAGADPAAMVARGGGGRAAPPRGRRTAGRRDRGGRCSTAPICWR